MKRVSQIDEPVKSVTPAVQTISPTPMTDQQKKVIEEQIRTIELDKQSKDKELSALQQLKQAIASLSDRLAQISAPKIPAGADPMGNLDRMEEYEQKEEEEQQQLDQQQDITNQQTLQMQQMMTQQNLQRKAGHWVKSERANIKIAIKDKNITCDVAVTPKQQASGLQAYDHLSDDHGLWFPQYCRRVATFHMGDVVFPIDIIFVDDNRISKIISDVQPRQAGSWSCGCTDVIEINGGWCGKNRIGVGDTIQTPLTNKKRAGRSEIERLLNTSWSAPQKSRITSDKDGAMTYDLLRTITEAGKEDPLFQDVIRLFPYLKEDEPQSQPTEVPDLDHLSDEEYDEYMKKHMGPEKYTKMVEDYKNRPSKKNAQEDYKNRPSKKNAQENYKVKPVTYREQPGEVDKRNPTDRFRHSDVPLIGGGEDAINYNPINPADPSVTQYDQSHFEQQIGYDPITFREEDHPYAIRPSAQKVTVESSVDFDKLVDGMTQLYNKLKPKWKQGKEDDKYRAVAIIDDKLISNWINSLGFSQEQNDLIKENVYTDKFKKALGEKLTQIGFEDNIKSYELLGNDLLIYSM